MASTGMARVLPVVLVVLTGCGGPRPVPVHGKITRDGVPIPRATLIFSPVGAGSRPASGTADGDGRYAATTDRPGDGLMPGEYRVAVQPAVVPEVGAEGKKARPNVPPRYTDPGTSGLSLTIMPGDSARQFDVALKN